MSRRLLVRRLVFLSFVSLLVVTGISLRAQDSTSWFAEYYDNEILYGDPKSAVKKAPSPSIGVSILPARASRPMASARASGQTPTSPAAPIASNSALMMPSISSLTVSSSSPPTMRRAQDRHSSPSWC